MPSQSAAGEAAGGRSRRDWPRPPVINITILITITITTTLTIIIIIVIIVITITSIIIITITSDVVESSAATMAVEAYTITRYNVT